MSLFNHCFTQNTARMQNAGMMRFNLQHTYVERKKIRGKNLRISVSIHKLKEKAPVEKKATLYRRHSEPEIYKYTQSS